MSNKRFITWTPPNIYGKEMKVQNTKVQIRIIDDNPPIPEQFLNAFIEKKCENQNI